MCSHRLAKRLHFDRVTGKPCAAATKAKISASLMGRKFNQSSLEKMRAASQNMTAERRANMSAAALGRLVSVETRAKKSAALKGRPWSAARRAAFVDKHYRL